MTRHPQQRSRDGLGGLRDGSAGYEELRTQAVALRREGLSRRQSRDHLKVSNNDLLNRLLSSEPPPEWTRRPNAKDELRVRARELRRQGWTYDRIELALGVARSTVSRWVRDLPKPVRQRNPEEASKPWDHARPVREAARQRATDRAQREIGSMTPRELYLVGLGLYWAEGEKSKPHRFSEQVAFVNSDPGLINVFLAWLDLVGVGRDRLRFRVLIHESADVAAAEAYWSGLVGIRVTDLAKTTLKRHNLKTVRKNTGAQYRGCLVIRVREPAELYRRIEGGWYGIVDASTKREGTSRPS